MKNCIFRDSCESCWGTFRPVNSMIMLYREYLYSICISWVMALSYILKLLLVWKQILVFCTFDASTKHEEPSLLSLYWIPKLHAFPYKQNVVAVSTKCSEKTFLFHQRYKLGCTITVTLATPEVVWSRCGI